MTKFNGIFIENHKPIDVTNFDTIAYLNSLGHEVTEVRILRESPYLQLDGKARGEFVGKTVFGYYDNLNYEKLVADIAPYENDPETNGIYTTIQRCDPSLLARSANRLKQAGDNSATKDDNITHFVVFPIDIDSGHATGISATNAELEASKIIAGQIADALQSLDIPVVKAKSGNGWHISIYLAEPLAVTTETTKRFKRCGDIIVSKYGGDATVYNPARIWKLYGTTAKKGDSTPDRPHRQAKILEPADLSTIKRISFDDLEKAILSLEPTEPTTTKPDTHSTQNPPARRTNGKRLPPLNSRDDLERFARDCGVEEQGNWQEKPDYEACKTNCPLCHRDGCGVITYSASGECGFKCHTNTCSGKNFQSLYESAGYTKAPEQPNGNPSKAKAEAKTGKPDAESKPPARPKRENPLPKLKDGSDYFVHDDFNVLAMSAFIQSKYRIWAQDAGIFVYNKKTGIYELGEMDIDKAVREELGILRKKKFTDEVLADLRACCRITDLPDTSNLIGFRNGVLELAFGKDEVLQWKQHSPDNYLTTVFPVEFNLNAPENDGQKDFDNWLTEALGGDMGLVKVCYEVIGSIFHKGSVAMQRGVLMVGEGGTGKSLLLDLIEIMIGQKNLCARSWWEFGNSEFAFGDLHGKALAMDSDILVEKPISGALKPAVTGNILTCNQKNKQPFDFKPFATWIAGINKFPKTRDKTWGFFRRWIVIPWNKNYETDSQFAVKKQRLWTETETLSRIVSDAISLYITAYLQGSFSVPDVAKELQREMYQSANSVITWLDNETQKPSDNMDTDLTQFLTRADAYAAYEEYCRQHNRDAENNRNFLSTLRSQGFDCDKKITIGGARERYIEGLFLL